MQRTDQSSAIRIAQFTLDSNNGSSVV